MLPAVSFAKTRARQVSGGSQSWPMLCPLCLPPSPRSSRCPPEPSLVSLQHSAELQRGGGLLSGSCPELHLLGRPAKGEAKRETVGVRWGIWVNQALGSTDQ